jgi:hypothetical protein
MDPEDVKDHLLAAQSKFLNANYSEFVKVKDLVSRGLPATVAEARLQNKWKGAVLKQLERMKSSGSKKAAAKAAPAPKQVESIGIDDPYFATNFTSSFMKEARERGLVK